MKIGGSPSKPKYTPITDSEQVLWRKGEKYFGKKGEKELEIALQKQLYLITYLLHNGPAS